MTSITGLTLALLSTSALSQAAEDFVCKSNGPRLHQLRVYEIIRDKREPFHQRFKEHALRIMKRHGFKVLDMWESDTVDKLQFIYLLEWTDAKTMEAKWKDFLSDQEWIDIKKRSAAERGDLVKSAVGQPLHRVSYSPGCAAPD